MATKITPALSIQTATISSAFACTAQLARADGANNLASAVDTLTGFTGTFSFTNGAGANQANAVWSDIREVQPGENDDLDLSNLPAGGSAWGAAISLQNVKALVIQNDSAANSLVIGAAPSDPWIGIFGGATDEIVIPPGARWSLAFPGPGLAVNGGSKVLRFTPGTVNSLLLTYRVAILGVRA